MICPYCATTIHPVPTLDTLFGFYFIEPAKTAARKASLVARIAP